MEDHNYSATKKRCKSHATCLVPGCKSGVNDYVSFFSFPREIQQKRRRTWLRLLRLTEPILPHRMVCSAHFLDSDMIKPTIARPYPLLKRYAIPSQKLPKITRQYDENSSRAKRTAERAARREAHVYERPPLQMSFIAVDDSDTKVDVSAIVVKVEVEEVEKQDAACQTDAEVVDVGERKICLKQIFFK